jgi:transcriptional regulator with XRE-family HTH domain
MAADQGSFYRELGKRLQKARKAAGLNQQKIAAVAGLTRTSITNIENGRQPLHVEALCKIAAAVKVSILDLIPELPKLTPTLPSNLQPEQREWVTRVLAAGAGNAKIKKERADHGAAIQRSKAESRGTT